MPALRAEKSLTLPTQDTHTALWTLKGECIGVFGKITWVLNDPGTWTDPLLHSMRPALRDANGKSKASITDPHQLPAGAPRARAMARSIMRRASTFKGALKPEAMESSPQSAWSPRSDTSAVSMATPAAEHTQQLSSVRSPACESASAHDAVRCHNAERRLLVSLRRSKPASWPPCTSSARLPLKARPVRCAAVKDDLQQTRAGGPNKLSI